MDRYRLSFQEERDIPGGWHVHQKRKLRRALPERIAKANTRHSKVRAQVEHVFAGQKHRMGIILRTIGIARATVKIGIANLVYNFQRLPGSRGVLLPLDVSQWPPTVNPALAAPEKWKSSKSTQQHQSCHAAAIHNVDPTSKSSGSSGFPACS